ncbi:MAG: AMP-binding protein [Clostridia bacterium]
MKIAFSTLGCPEFGWVDIYSMAKDFHFDGIEVRGMGQDLYAYNAAPFTQLQIEKTIAKLCKLRLEIPCLSSGCALKFADKREETIAEIRRYIRLADKLHTPYIRILADREPQVTGDVDDAYIAEMLRELAKEVEGTAVTLLVETNGVYADTARLRKLLDSVDHPAIAALWDVHHPYRFFGETPKQTVEHLGSYIKYMHVKDSVIEDGRVSYRMLGDGDLPITEMLDAVTEAGYDGYVSLEWVKRWARDLTDPGIVFPQFANYMQNYIDRHLLQRDNRHAGHYVWKKETLIDMTFSEVLDRMVKEFPDQDAFRYTTHYYTRTYAQFRDDVDTFARALIAMGVGAGDHVAIWATNVPQWYITFWATVKIGAVLVTVNTAYKIHEAEYLLRQSDTHTLVMIDGYKDANYQKIISELCPELEACEPGKLSSKRLPKLRNVVTVDGALPGCYTWEDALDLAEEVPLDAVIARAARVKPSDVCNMQYTSGTTGFPKGVMLTHFNVVNNGKAIGDCMDLSTADRMMIQVPMFHCFGMVLAMTASMTHGVTMCPIPYFSPRVALECVNREQITAFHGVPTMFIAMLEHKNFATTDFSHMRTGIMAGSPCPVKVMQDVVTKMHMPEICITYGQTEASPGCTMSKTTDSIDTRVATVGSAMFGVTCKVVDPETYQDLPDETDGEFVARGYNIMKGYYKMPEATSAVIDEEGWLHTGDLARRTREGNYKITGRIKDMIIRGGENIYPKEIEEFLYTHPSVKDVQVIGVPDKQYGEEIMACIVLKAGECPTPEELRAFCVSHMAKHKCPKYFDFVDGFPMNAAGKILKYKMREDAIEKLSLQADSHIETA